MTSAVSTVSPARVFRVRQIALPTEHGGWGFLLEPLVAGVAIAFSVAAPWIALMTIGAFLTRQPLRVLIIDRLGMKEYDRAWVAFLFCLLYSSVFVAGFAGTVVTTGPSVLLPFAFVAPLVPFLVYSDVLRQSRQLVPEIVGAISISASVSAIGLAGGLSMTASLALWAIFISRLVPSILYVRQRLRLEKGKRYSRIAPAAAHIAALIVVGVLASYGLVPYMTLFAMALTLFRAVLGLSPGRKRMRAMQIGIRELIYGTLTVLSVIVGHFAGL